MPRRLLLVLVAAAAVAGASAPAARAEQNTVGSPLTASPNTTFGCEARPYPDVTSPSGIQYLRTGTSSCMWWSTTYTSQPGVYVSTYLPVGAGKVYKARVRSGPSPAPLRIAIVSSSRGSGCCTTRIEGPTFQPTPNAVTEVPLDLPSGSGVEPAQAGMPASGQQYSDIAVVEAVGPGTLPVAETGPHGTFDMSAGRTFASFLHPALPSGQSNTDVGLMDGFEVLLQVDWCGTYQRDVALALPAVGAAVPGCPGGTTGGGGTPTPTPTPTGTAPGAQPTAAAPTLTARATTAKLRGSRVALRLRCGTAAACTGSLRLLRASGRGAALGTARVSVPAGATQTVAVKLTPAARRTIRRARSTKAVAVVALGGGTTARLPVTLER